MLTFDFNDHAYNEAHDLVPAAKGVGTSLTEDRFGNERSAVFIGGNLHSYLNLGSPQMMASKKITFSMWVNLSRKVYSGKGYECNPILIVKNGPQDDFVYAYSIAYDFYTGRLGVGSSKDSLNEAGVISVNKPRFGEWYHLVFTSDTNFISFYLNGNFQGRCPKNFVADLWPSDSVMIGHTANKKNERFSLGSFDDIKIFNRVLSDKEVMALYHAPDPNKKRLALIFIFKCLGVAAGIALAAFLLVWRRRGALKRAQEKLDINRRLHEMETRTLKAQMNPHFIFNSLNSIKQFVMMNENKKAELYLAKFSKLIRELLESNLNESLTITEEVGILTGYLEMESLRFGNSFSFSITVDERIEAPRLHIPHLMIQPFVENAIWHGLLSRDGDRNLWIRFEYDTEKTLRCIIEDNGIGRKSSQQRESTFKRKSLALSFVTQRLELMKHNLGIDLSVQILDKEDPEGKSQGTLVRIVLPYIITKNAESHHH